MNTTCILPLAAVDLGYGPIGLLIAFVMVVATGIIVVTQTMPKAKRSGPRKDATYESGMEPVGDARQRFNVRFYMVAMLFLLFDVELIFMYPWARVFTQSAHAGAAAAADTTFLFFEMVIFFVILLVGFIYAWGKGIFQYD
ncbi:MAG: NADH-quinone oxidoreductase subunit A [Planctomycetes bacterium]|nr:NADH-quinone oxidoreductase subunit A [Planctomycetota bacterium]